MFHSQCTHRAPPGEVKGGVWDRNPTPSGAPPVPVAPQHRPQHMTGSARGCPVCPGRGALHARVPVMPVLLLAGGKLLDPKLAHLHPPVLQCAMIPTDRR
uniref:Uncharacterized protein n=1 Tax=Eutreptiella gymnastica TaxID=73025 RepID=A0A7S4GFL8_9EUGL